MPSDFRRILLEAIIIFALGAILGLSANFRLVSNLLEGKTIAGPPVAAPGAESPEVYPNPVDLADFQELRQRGAVVVDARIVELYAEGHVPEARSLPLDEIDERLPAFRRVVPSTATILAYCSGYGCPDSFDLAVRLLKEGFQDVRVFEGGFPEWRDAGLPVAEGGP